MLSRALLEISNPCGDYINLTGFKNTLGFSVIIKQTVLNNIHCYHLLNEMSLRPENTRIECNLFLASLALKTFVVIF